MNLRNLALIPVLSLIISIFATLFLDLSEKLAFNPPYLLLTLNLIFWATATLAIAVISAKSFLKEDSSIVLIISCSIIIFALPVIISGWVQTFSVNESIALSNPCILVASILQVIGSILAFQGKQETKTSNRKRLLATAYLASVIFVLANLTVALLGYYPPFFVASGPTLLRQVVLGSAVFFFAVAAIIFGMQYLRAKSSSLYWYALAIGLFSIGLFSAFEQKSIGDIPTWLGRIALYVGTLYLTAALLSTKKAAKGTDRATAWAESFRSNPQQLTTFFSRMFDEFTYCKILTNKDGKPVDYVYLDVNEAAVNVIGLKKNEVLGKKASEIMKIDALEDWLAFVGPVALKGEPITLDHLSKFTGRWVHVSVYSPQKGYFVSISEDITERKKAEETLNKLNEELEERVLKRTEELSAERQRLYNVLETLPAYVILLDKDYCVPFANKVFRERFGESHGRRCYDFLFERESPCENCETYKVLKTNGPHRWEWTGPDGRDYDVYDFPFVETDGSTLILEMGIDITERKRAEKQIRDVSLYSRSLIEASLDPLLTISTEGKITDVNQATELATGCSREELIGSDFSDYFTEPEKAKIGYKQVFSEGFVRDYPLAIKHKSGKITDVLYNATIYTNEAGEMQGVFAAARDITERKKAEEQAQVAAKKLKDAERFAAIGATAGMVGHDIRNPLQAITSDLFLAKSEISELPENENTTNAIESLDEIQNNIDYINKIVADLQDFARPLNPRSQETNIKSLFNDVLAKNGIPKNIKVTVKVEDKAEKIMADPDYLKRIAANLTLNAVQAMPDGGKLTIRAYVEEQTNDVLITVKDTGVGIPEDIKPKLFTPMTTTKSKGQGFGLAVVKRMTEGLGGTVTFKSIEGKGTTFIVHLPSPKEPNVKLT